MAGGVEVAQVEESRSRFRYLCVEVLVLCSLHLPSIIGAVLARPERTTADVYAKNATFHVVMLLAWLAIYLFVMVTDDEPLTYFGISPWRWKRDLTVFALFVPVLFLEWFGSQELARIAKPLFSHAQLSPLWLVAAVGLTTAVFEETVFRGYLVPRLEEITGKAWIAVIGSASFYAVTGISLGPIGMLGNFLFGLVAGAAFVNYRSLWPLIAMHATMSVWALLSAVSALHGLR